MTPTPPSGRCSAPRSPLPLTSLAHIARSLAHIARSSPSGLCVCRHARGLADCRAAGASAGRVVRVKGTERYRRQVGIDPLLHPTLPSSHPSVIPPFLTPRSFDPQVFPAAGGAAVREGGPAAGGAERRGDGRGDRGGCRRDEGCRGGESVHGSVVKGVAGGDLGGYCPR